MTESGDKRPLWAPWRIRYILDDRDNNDGCFICNHAADPANDLENHVIARGKVCFVFLNRYPYNSGHILVSPYRHVAGLGELTTEERHELVDLVTVAEDVCRKAMNPDGFNMGANLGHVAGAAIEDHVHLHLVPRWSGDTNFMPVIADIGCVPQALEETAAVLRKHWPA